ncbi:MAG: hypothetical protein ABIC57_00515 [bacterium]
MAKLGESKGKGKKYPATVLMLARDQYIKGFQYNQIAKKVSEITGRSCSPIIVSKWAKKYKWENDRISYVAAAINALDKDNVGQIARDLGDQVTAYREIRVKGLEELVKKGARSAGEAAEMIDKSIKGERQISMGTLAIRFLEQFASIVREEFGKLKCHECGVELDGDSLSSIVAARCKAFIVREVTQ